MIRWLHTGGCGSLRLHNELPGRITNSIVNPAARSVPDRSPELSPSDLLKRALSRAFAPGAAAYAAALIVLGAVVLLHRAADIPIGDLTRDASSSQGFPVYVGLVSNLGILLWCATATGCAVSAVVSRMSHRAPVPWTFFLCAGALSALLMIDDLLLFHENLLPRHLGVPELVTYATYAFCVFGFLFGFRSTILQTAFPLLLTAGGFLALGMMADTFTNDMADTSNKFLIEDGFKFLGICGWFAYFTHTGLVSLTQLVRSSDTP